MQRKKDDIGRCVEKEAKKIFLKKGYAKTLMREIAEKSGVGLSNIYNYFIQLGGQELRVQRITSGDEEDKKYVDGKEVGIRFVGEKYYTREEVANV